MPISGYRKEAGGNKDLVMAPRLVVVSLGFFGAVVVRFIIVNIALPAYYSPIRNVPGPEQEGFFDSNLPALLE